MEDRVKIEIIKVDILKNRIFFKSNYPWKVCFNANSESEFHVYSLPFNYVNLLKLKKIGCDFHDSDQQVQEFISNYVFLSTKQLRTYQKLDVDFLSKMNSVAIFNEMRTGKTPTSLVLTCRWGISNLLIIIPGILQQQWQNSVEEWIGKPAYIISQLSRNERHFFYKKFCLENNFVLIVSKEIFKIDSLHFNNLRKSFRNKFVNFCTIVDESHYLRNYKSQQSKSIYSLDDSRYKILITGTPIVNNYSDIFGILRFINPKKYNSYWKFVEFFFNIQTLDFVKSGKKVFLKTIKNFKNKTLETQLKNEIASFSVSRKQKDVLSWLPMVIYHKEVLIMDEPQQNLYNKWSNSKNYSLELLSFLKSIVLYPKYLFPEFNFNGVKIDYLLNFCKDNQDKRILIFSTRSETFLDPLSKALTEKKINFGMIVGKTNKIDRINYISSFQQLKLKILLCNIQSAGFGLNLNQADTIIFADRSYSPADNKQAESRFLPTDKSSNLNIKSIIDLVCKDTIDEKILKLLDKKKDIMKIINSDPHLIFEN